MIRVRLLQFIARRFWDAGDLIREGGKRSSLAFIRFGDRAWQASDKARKS